MFDAGMSGHLSRLSSRQNSREELDRTHIRAPCPEHSVSQPGEEGAGGPALPCALRGPQLGPWILNRAPRQRRERYCTQEMVGR